MKTYKKLLLVLLVCVSMALTFGMGLLPSSNLLGVSASSNEDAVDMARLLDLILGGGKQVETAVITSPRHLSTVKFLYGSDMALLPIQADVFPVEAGSEVKFGMDGTRELGGPGWNGTVTSAFATVGPPAAASIDLFDLGAKMVGTHSLYALKQSTGAYSIYTYGVLDEIALVVTGVYQSVSDVNMDGILDNPFTELSRGDIYIATVVGGDGVTQKTVAMVDLDPPVAKQTNPLGILVPIQSGNVQVQLLTPTLSMLQDAGVLPLNANTQGILIAEIAPDLATLTSPSEAANADPLPGPVAFGGQFVEVSIVYSVDNGGTFTEVTNLTGGLSVAMSIYGLTMDPMPARGAGIWSHNSDVDFSLGVTIPAGQDWGKRRGSTLNALNQSMSVYLTYLSVFAPIESQFVISAIYPDLGPAVGGNTVRITGFFPTLAQSGSAASVYFGDPSLSGTLAEPHSSVLPLFIEVHPQGIAGLTTETTVDVVVADASAVSDFVTALSAYTYVPTPQITSISPTSGLVTGGTLVTITGSALSRTTSVYIAGVASLQYSVISDVEVTALTRGVPEVRTGNITIKTLGGTAVSAETFTYAPVSGIDSISPLSGSEFGGTVVTIDGFGLDTTQSVTIAGVRTPLFTINSATQVVATTLPAPAGTSGVVEVVTTGGTFASAEVFAYTAEAPVIQDFDPQLGSIVGGEIIIINGQALNNSPVITIAGVSAMLVLGDASSLVVRTGTTGAAVTGKVIVTTTGGTATSVDDFEYFDPAATPTIASFSPATGPIEGGTDVAIVGTNLGHVMSVTVAGVAVSSGAIVEVDSMNLMITTAAATANGAGPIVVTTLTGEATSPTEFRYGPAPEPMMCFAGESFGGGSSWAGALSGDVLLLAFVAGVLMFSRRRFI